MDIDEEQVEILETVETVLANCSGSRWGKFQGDVIPRIIASYISKHLPLSYKVVGPNVYIEDNPIEFDLMIVDSETGAIPHTSAYPDTSIRAVIEVKRIGVIASLNKLEPALKKIRDNFESATHKRIREANSLRFVVIARPNCRAAYLSIGETINPLREKSIRYGDITRKVLAPYPAFILSDLRGNIPQPGEWKRFIQYLTESL
ncbi:MAG: hypothetical protein WCA51_04900 [Dehalococcoidia bacterium]